MRDSSRVNASPAPMRQLGATARSAQARRPKLVQKRRRVNRLARPAAQRLALTARLPRNGGAQKIKPRWRALQQAAALIANLNARFAQTPGQPL